MRERYRIYIYTQTHTKTLERLILTNISGGSVFIGILIKLPGSPWVHLYKRYTPLTPDFLWLIDRKERVKQQIDNASTYRPGIDLKLGQQVFHRANLPELGKTARTVYLKTQNFWIFLSNTKLSSQKRCRILLKIR